MITIEDLNALSKEEAFTQFEQCCVAKRWINLMVDSRPFSSEKDVIARAAAIWYNECSIGDFKEAFTGHPKIGDLTSLKEKFSSTKIWAKGEQLKVEEATEATLSELAKANNLYETKFGYIFIVSASGKSALELLEILKTRLQHEVHDEIHIAMNEQHKITVIRLNKLIAGLEERIVMKSHITTHALDTSIGLPARKMLIALKCFKNNEWKHLSMGITDSDGRISDMLAPGCVLNPGDYQMVFYTKDYYLTHEQSGFYPEVSINFSVKDDAHYHIPLLINPYGYSTYRGN